MPLIPTLHRIGAVSSLSGVPVPTLRGWEVRYATFSPQKSGGSHRLYSDEDVLRATLLKQLTASGHAISSIAKLDATRLNTLLQQQRDAQGGKVQQYLQRDAVALALVGLPLAVRIESKAFTLNFSANAVRVTDLFADLGSALAAPFQAQPHLLMVRVNSLHVPVQRDIQQLVEKHNILQVIVLYNYGQAQVVVSLKRSGMIVRREPISDAELADVVSSLLLVDTAKSLGGLRPGAMIPPRKYSDETLTRVAGIATRVLCECPRHVAELITQLASFEQYSQECLSNSADDAHLHAYLSSVSGSARALFEHALERVAQHEGIQLNLAVTVSDTLSGI